MEEDARSSSVERVAFPFTVYFPTLARRSLMKPAHAMLMPTPDRKLFGQVVRVLMLCLCRNYLFSRQSHTTEEAQTELYDAKLRHFSHGRAGLMIIVCCLSPSRCYPKTHRIASLSVHLARSTSVESCQHCADCVKTSQAHEHRKQSTILNCFHMKMLVNSTARTKHPNAKNAPVPH